MLTRYQWFISVAGEVEGGTLTLHPLELHHPLLSQQALIQLVHSHYMRVALPALLTVLGSSNVLGKQQWQSWSSLHSDAEPGWLAPAWQAVNGSVLLHVFRYCCHTHSLPAVPAADEQVLDVNTNMCEEVNLHVELNPSFCLVWTQKSPTKSRSPQKATGCKSSVGIGPHIPQGSGVRPKHRNSYCTYLTLTKTRM